jgi:O-antigen/teichoic acid export membrane protein
MWLQRQLQIQRKNERMMQLVLGLSVVFDVLVIVVLFTFLRDMLDLPDIVTYLVIGGLALEMALLAYFTSRASKRRREIQQEIDLITRGYTQS